MRILFLCHGNICRSAAAEAIFLHLAEKRGVSHLFEVDSAGVSDEEEGNAMYGPMRAELSYRNIPIPPHRARQVSRKDIDYNDLILYMDESNRRILSWDHLLTEKVKPIFFLTPSLNEIEDPWYTRRFRKVADEITLCCEDILSYCLKNKNLK